MNAPHRRGAAVRQAGFTLIELMVAIAIALFIAAAVLSLYLNMKTTYNAQDGLAQLQDSERLVLTMMTTTVQSAGYFVNPVNDTAASALPAATVTRADGSSTVFAAGQIVSGTGNGTGNDTIAVQYQTANGDGLLNCAGASNASGSTAVMFSYFSLSAANELTCTVGSGSAVPLAGNVGGMTILYGVDTDGDARMDAYMPASGVTAAGLWGSVYTAKVTLTFLDTTQSRTGSPVLMPQPVVQTINLMNRQ